MSSIDLSLALKVGASSSPHLSSQLLGQENQSIVDFVSFFKAKAAQGERMMGDEGALPGCLGEPPQLLEGSTEVGRRSGTAQSDGAVGAEPAWVDNAPPIPREEVVGQAYAGQAQLVGGGGHQSMSELAEALEVRAPMP